MPATSSIGGEYLASPNKVVRAANAIDYTHRDVGEGTPPLVLLQHFRGNLDNWDPALIDALASARRVVTFDNVGVGGSTGTTPSTVTQMASDAIAFLEAMEFETVDILGFSIGSFVAQEIALIRPASSPRFGPSVVNPPGRRWDAWLGARSDRCRRRPHHEPRRVPRCFLRGLTAWGIADHSLLQRVSATGQAEAMPLDLITRALANRWVVRAMVGHHTGRGRRVRLWRDQGVRLCTLQGPSPAYGDPQSPFARAQGLAVPRGDAPSSHRSGRRRTPPIRPRSPAIRMVGPAVASPDSGEGSMIVSGEHTQHPDGERPHTELPVTESQTAHRRR